MKKEQEHILATIRKCLANIGKEINPVMYSAREWLKYKNTSFCKNVEKEGIRL